MTNRLTDHTTQSVTTDHIYIHSTGMRSKNKQNKHKKLKPGLVTSYDIPSGNREGLFLFWHFINLSLTYLFIHLLAYGPGTSTGQAHVKTGGGHVVARFEKHSQLTGSTSVILEHIIFKSVPSSASSTDCTCNGQQDACTPTGIHGSSDFNRRKKNIKINRIKLHLKALVP